MVMVLFIASKMRRSIDFGKSASNRPSRDSAEATMKRQP
jgi:hypothetical protein